jgi:hypothetical protein
MACLEFVGCFDSVIVGFLHAKLFECGWLQSNRPSLDVVPVELRLVMLFVV